MSWVDQLLWPALAIVGLVFTVLVSVLLSTWLASRQLRQVHDELVQKIRRLNDTIADLPRHTYGPAAGARARAEEQPRYVSPYDRIAERPAVGDEYTRPASIISQPPPVDPLGTQDDAAAAALADRDSFRSFADRHGGKGHVLGQAGGVPAISDSDFGADLWAIPCPDGLLIYPGFNLRRTQSSLVADSGRLAEEWLGGCTRSRPGLPSGLFGPRLLPKTGR